MLWQYSGLDTDVVIPAGVKEIAEYTFLDKGYIKSVTLPEGLRSISRRSFEGCAGLESITIPDSVISVGEYAFSRCSALKKLKLSANMKVIESNTFKGCSSLKEVRIPKSVRSIEVGAFADCTSLELVYIPYSTDNLDIIFGQHPFKGSDKVVIHTPARSAAEAFAKKCGLPFMNEPEPDSAAVQIPAAKPVIRPEPKPIPKPEPKPVQKPAQKSEQKPAPRPEPEVKTAGSAASDKRVQRAEARLRKQVEAAEARQRRQAEAAERKKAQEEARREKAERRQAEAEQKKAESEARRADARAAKAAAKEAKHSTGPSSKTIVILLVAALLAGAVIAAVAMDTIWKRDANTAEYTLEEFVEVNPDARLQIQQSVDGTNVSVYVSANELIYKYDLSEVEGMTEDAAKDSEVVSALQDTLDSGDNRFIALCQSLENDTGIKGITVKVIYTYGDDRLVSRTYTSNGKY